MSATVIYDDNGKAAFVVVPFAEWEELQACVTSSHRPNAETLAAMEEARSGTLKGYTSPKELWSDLEVDA